MAFGFKKKTNNNFDIVSHDEILGYLDELVSKKTEVTIITSKAKFKCNLYTISEDCKLIRLQNIQELFNFANQKVKCGFSIDKAWYSFNTKIIVQKEDLFIFTPQEIKYSERRKNLRAVFSPREEVKVTVVESIGSGIGVFGMGVNISKNGLCLNIDKAMMLSNEKVLIPFKEMYKPNADLMLIKVNRIPGGQPFETSGKVNRVYKDGGKWKLAIEFSKLPSSAASQIARFVETRAVEFKPVKRSRKKRQEIEKNRNNGSTERFIPKKEVKKPIIKTTQEKPKENELEKPKVTVVTLGEELNNNLEFLNGIKSINWVKGENQIQILALIHEVNADVLLLPLVLGDHNMIDYLQKIKSMGLIDDINTAIFSEAPVPVKERIKGKAVNVENYFTLPINDKLRVINYIKNVKKQ